MTKKKAGAERRGVGSSTWPGCDDDATEASSLQWAYLAGAVLRSSCAGAFLLIGGAKSHLTEGKRFVGGVGKKKGVSRSTLGKKGNRGNKGVNPSWGSAENNRAKEQRYQEKKHRRGCSLHKGTASSPP